MPWESAMPEFITAGPVGEATFVTFGLSGGGWNSRGGRISGGVVYILLKGN